MLQSKLRWSATLAVAFLAAALPVLGQLPSSLIGNQREVTALLFLPDGKTVAATSLDESIRIYDMTTGKETGAILQAHKEGVWAAALSPDGKVIASGGGDKMIRLWDSATLKEIRRLVGHTKLVLTVAFSPDGKTLASGGGGGDRTIRIWDIATGKQKNLWHGHEQIVTSIAYSPDGKTLASGGMSTPAIAGLIQPGFHADLVRFWDAETGKEIRQHSQRGTTVFFTPHGNAIAAAGSCVSGKLREDGVVFGSRETVAVIAPLSQGKSWVEIKGAGTGLALSLDGRLAAMTYGSQFSFPSMSGRVANEPQPNLGRTSIWETYTGKEIIQVAETFATVAAISRDGKKLATGSSNGNVKFWDLAPKDWPYSEKAPVLAKNDFEDLWIDLADEEAATAYAAVWTLAAAGNSAVDFL